MSGEHVQGNNVISSLVNANIPVANNENTAANSTVRRIAKVHLLMSAGISTLLVSLAAPILMLRAEAEPLSTTWGYPVFLLGALGTVSGAIMMLYSLSTAETERAE